MFTTSHCDSAQLEKCWTVRHFLSPGIGLSIENTMVQHLCRISPAMSTFRFQMMMETSPRSWRPAPSGPVGSCRLRSSTSPWSGIKTSIETCGAALTSSAAGLKLPTQRRHQLRQAPDLGKNSIGKRWKKMDSWWLMNHSPAIQPEILQFVPIFSPDVSTVLYFPIRSALVLRRQDGAGRGPRVDPQRCRGTCPPGPTFLGFTCGKSIGKSSRRSYGLENSGKIYPIGKSSGKSDGLENSGTISWIEYSMWIG